MKTEHLNETSGFGVSSRDRLPRYHIQIHKRDTTFRTTTCLDGLRK